MDIVSPGSDGKPSDGPVVSFVNGAWVDLHFSLQPSFKELVENTYRAEAKAVDFQQKEEVCREINLWASRATEGLIDQVLSPEILQQDSMLILGNALFFKAAWVHPFTCCMKMQFRLLNGKTAEAPFMTLYRLPHQFTGASFEDFRLVRLPYERGQDNDDRKFAMYIFLPNADDGLVSLMQKFGNDPSFLDQKFELYSVILQDLWIPKFKFSHTFSASNTLKQLGVDRMFRCVGELNKIVDKASSELLAVSEICQKSVIEVNEEGTLAASVTLCLAGGGGGPLPLPHVFHFVADHPFMFMIREEISGVTFFVGTVLNPVSD